MGDVGRRLGAGGGYLVGGHADVGVLVCLCPFRRWNSLVSFALNGDFCGWAGRGERLLRAKLFWGGAGARNQVQSRAEYRCTLLSSSDISQ